MRIAFFLFPRLTLLDFAGVYDALRRIPLLQIDPAVSLHIIATESPLDDEGGTRIVPHSVYPSLDEYDLLIVPGGLGTRALGDEAIDYLRTWGREKPLASVCTGALLIGRAGLLEGRRATTHFDHYQRLAPYCREVIRDVRVVEDGHVVTAGAVSSSLDLGLHLVEKYWHARERVALSMSYSST
jgi:cyclohexyl-isocyanide hydratase